MKRLVEFDAAGQEMRLMADFSQDQALLRIFNSPKPYDDAHSYTGAQLAGMSFEDFLKAKDAGNEAVVGEHGYRYCGKFVNLSNQYRVGAKKARIQARVQYGLNRDIHTIRSWQAAYHRAYPGVKMYWDSAIRRAKELGYAETKGGRRFYISDYSEDRRWSSESSAINYPIQGTGADMKELAIAVMARRHPGFEFAFDLHDGLFFYFEGTDEYITEARETLNQLPYEAAWGWVPSVPMTWDASVGPSWGEMKEL